MFAVRKKIVKCPIPRPEDLVRIKEFQEGKS